MPEHHEDRISERLASLEARISELDRQQKAAWERIDDGTEKLRGVEMEEVRRTAKFEEKIAGLEKDSLKENFSIRAQVAEIGWRVGLLVTVAVLIANFILSKINLGDIMGKQPTTDARGKRP